MTDRRSQNTPDAQDLEAAPAPRVNSRELAIRRKRQVVGASVIAFEIGRAHV